MFNFSSIRGALTRPISKVALKVGNWSPEILTGVGIAGVVTTVVLASKATLKLSDVVEEAKKNLDIIDQVRAKEDLGVYPQQDHVADLAKVYAKTAVDLAKLYGPALIVGTLSIACFIKSNKILRTRNVALAAAYKALETAYNKYRERIIEEFGEDKDRQIRYDLKEEEFETEKDGKKHKEKVVTSNIGDMSPYAKYFDKHNNNWDRDPELNLFFLQSGQNVLNQRLQTRGYVTLNEAYKILGFEETSAGSVVGWVYDPELSDGDLEIDLGIYDTKRRIHDSEGYMRSILVDFNVDGMIYQKIDEINKPGRR